MGNIETTTKVSRLKSIFSIEDNYLRAATWGVQKKKTVLKNFAIFTGKYLCWSVIVQFNVSILNRLKCFFFLVLFFVQIQSA